MAEPVNLVLLQSLVEVADRRGFTRAARALHVSQSTVSQHIKQLEQRLGADLIRRDQRGTQLTVAGEALVREARSLLRAHDRMLHRFERPGADTLDVGATEHAAEELLPRLLSAFRAAHPAVTVTFALDRSVNLTDAVARGDLDLAITLSMADDGPGVRVGVLELRWVASTAVASEWTGGAVRLSAFDVPCPIRARALDLLERNGIEASVVVQSATLTGVASAVRAGLGIALLPVGTRLPPGLVELSGLPEAGCMGVHLVARDGLADRWRASAFDALREYLQPDGDIDISDIDPSEIIVGPSDARSIESVI